MLRTSEAPARAHNNEPVSPDDARPVSAASPDDQGHELRAECELLAKPTTNDEERRRSDELLASTCNEDATTMFRQTGDNNNNGEPRRRGRPHDEFHRSYDKRISNTNQQDTNASKTIETRLLVRRREAGALIGKRGENIKRLRLIHKGALFNIPDTGNGPERVVCIETRSLEQLEPILVDLMQLFHEKQHSNWAHQPSGGAAAPNDQQEATVATAAAAATSGRTMASETIEVKLLVNATHAGSLIGMGGQAIKKLRNDSKAAIKIFEMCCPLSSERVCAIKGRPPVVVSTIRMIYEQLAQTPIKGLHKPYDALNFDESLADKYGGFAPDDDCCSSLPLGAPLRLAPKSPTLTPAGLGPVSPLELLHQQLQHQPTDPTALLLQSHAIRLLAAAAAANANADHHQPQHLEPSHMRPNPATRGNSRAFSNRPQPPVVSHYEHQRRTDAATASMMAALAAEKYHSVVRAGHQALAASRFHPYHPLGATHHHHQHNQAHARQQLAANRHRCGGSGGHCLQQHQACSCRSSRSPARQGQASAMVSSDELAPVTQVDRNSSSSSSTTSSYADSPAASGVAGGK